MVLFSVAGRLSVFQRGLPLYQRGLRAKNSLLYSAEILTTVRKNNSYGISNGCHPLSRTIVFFAHFFFSNRQRGDNSRKRIMSGVWNAGSPAQECCDSLPDREGVGF